MEWPSDNEGWEQDCPAILPRAGTNALKLPCRIRLSQDWQQITPLPLISPLLCPVSPTSLFGFSWDSFLINHSDRNSHLRDCFRNINISHVCLNLKPYLLLVRCLTSKRVKVENLIWLNRTLPVKGKMRSNDTRFRSREGVFWAYRERGKPLRVREMSVKHQRMCRLWPQWRKETSRMGRCDVAKE